MTEGDRDDSLLSGVLTAARRRWRVVALCSVLVPALAYGLSALQTPRYTAEASLLFRDPDFDRTLFGSTLLQPSADPAREAATNLRLVSLDVIAERTARRFSTTRRRVARKVAVAAEGLSDVVTVRATDPDPHVAARLANTFAAEYIAFRRNADRSQIREARRLVADRLAALTAAERAGERGRVLERRAEDLQLLATLQTGNAELAQRARPPERPASPKPVRNGMLGAALGLLLGLGLALTRERADRRVREPSDVERALGRPLLGTIPSSPVLARNDGFPQPGSAEAEGFGLLQANVRYFDVDRPIRSVLVTSPAQADGKSTVAWHTAAAAAGAGVQVLLVEADLRRPVIARTRRLRARTGLTTLLRGEHRLDDGIQRVDVVVDELSDLAFDVLVAGPVPPNPADLLDSERMRDLLAEAVERYDLVIVDTPPTSVVSDAIPLLRQVDGVVVVARLGTTTRDALARLREHLANVDAPLLGVVVNGATVRGAPYGYGQDADPARSGAFAAADGRRRHFPARVRG